MKVLLKEEKGGGFCYLPGRGLDRKVFFFCPKVKGCSDGRDKWKETFTEILRIF